MALRAKRDCIALETVAPGVELRRAVFAGQLLPPWLRPERKSDVEDDQAILPEDYDLPRRRSGARRAQRARVHADRA